MFTAKGGWLLADIMVFVPQSRSVLKNGFIRFISRGPSGLRIILKGLIPILVRTSRERVISIVGSFSENFGLKL
jgi:hypothetical protein